MSIDASASFFDPRHAASIVNTIERLRAAALARSERRMMAATIAAGVLATADSWSAISLATYSLEVADAIIEQTEPKEEPNG